MMGEHLVNQVPVIRVDTANHPIATASSIIKYDSIAADAEAVKACQTSFQGTNVAGLALEPTQSFANTTPRLWSQRSNKVNNLPCKLNLHREQSEACKFPYPLVPCEWRASQQDPP